LPELDDDERGALPNGVGVAGTLSDEEVDRTLVTVEFPSIGGALPKGSAEEEFAVIGVEVSPKRLSAD
jgi:hypothetical protein